MPSVAILTTRVNLRIVKWLTPNWRHSLLAACAMTIVVSAHAQAPADDWQQAERDSREWAPPLPDFDSNWDWIELTSGEWLKGELRSLDQDVVDFDSDKLGILSLDWDDIKSVYSARPMELMRRDNSLLVGRLTTVDGQLVVVGTGAQVPFRDVISIARQSTSEFDRWFVDIALGANLRGGNADQRDANVDLTLWRRTAKSSVRLNYIGNYSEFDGEENVNDHRATTSFDYRLDPVWFVRPFYGEFFRDPYQNVASRITAGFGAGLFLFDTPKLTWNVAVGPGYQETRFVDVPVGDPDKESTGIFFISSNYDHELTADIDLLFNYQLVMMEENSGRVAQHAMAAIDIDLTDALDLRLATYWDRLQQPQVDSEGVQPKKDDYRFVIGLDYEI